MKRLLGAAVGLCVLGGPAAAGGTAPHYDWSGVYLGVQGGLAGGTFEYPASLDIPATPLALSGSITDDSAGGFGGLTGGYNWQVNSNLLLGIETDISASSIDGSLGISGSASGLLSGSAKVSAGSKVNWFGTTRFRAGWVNGPLLVYGTGGLAYGETESFYNLSAGGLGSMKDSTSATSTGWTAGVGAEYMINPRWTLKTEYLYVDLGKETLFSADGFAGAGSSFKLSRDTAFHTVKVGLNYHWGAAGGGSDLALSAMPGADWSGLYLGVQGGLAGGTFEYPASLSIPATPISLKGSITDDSKGGFGGLTGGYNWQVDPNLVLGVETDIAAGDINGSLDISGSATGFGGSGSLKLSGGSKVNWFGTTRLRAGWANGPLLLYGTGGLAYGETESFYNASLTGLGSAKDSVSATSTGWAAGVGAEYMVGPHWTLKTEYLYVDLGKEELFSADGFAGAGSSFKLSRDTTFSTVRVGANYRW